MSLPSSSPDNRHIDRLSLVHLPLVMVKMKDPLLPLIILTGDDNIGRQADSTEALNKFVRMDSFKAMVVKILLQVPAQGQDLNEKNVFPVKERDQKFPLSKPRRTLNNSCHPVVRWRTRVAISQFVI